MGFLKLCNCRLANKVRAVFGSLVVVSVSGTLSASKLIFPVRFSFDFDFNIPDWLHWQVTSSEDVVGCFLLEMLTAQAASEQSFEDHL